MAMNLRRFMTLAGLIGVCVIILVNIGGLPKFVHSLSSLHWYVVPLMIAVQLVSYYANARYYRSFFALSHRRVGMRRLYEASLALNFANQALPSGGVVGTAYLTQAVKDEVPAGIVTLAQLGRYLFTFASYFAVLASGLLLLFMNGDSDLNQPSVRVTILIMGSVLIGAVILVAVFSERRRLGTVLRPVLGRINWISKVVFRRKQPLVKRAAAIEFLDDLYDGYANLLRRRRRLLPLFGWSLLYNLAEVATIYAVFIGLGKWVNPGIVITGYALAVVASIIGFVTGGIGVYELGMIGTFTALGLPFAESLTVVLVYRGLSMMLFLPPGLYFYRHHLRQGESE